MRCCQICGEPYWSYRGAPRHRCPPHWVVRRENVAIEHVYAKTDAKAASKWAQQHRGVECIIWVQRANDPDERATFFVSGGKAERTD